MNLFGAINLVILDGTKRVLNDVHITWIGRCLELSIGRLSTIVFIRFSFYYYYECICQCQDNCDLKGQIIKCWNHEIYRAPINKAE